MVLEYPSGKEIKKGDRVLLNGSPGEIELVTDPNVQDSETAWYVEQYGHGVLVKEPRVFGRIFLTQEQVLEGFPHLEFVSRWPQQA